MYSSSLHRVVTTPMQYGWTWDFAAAPADDFSAAPAVANTSGLAAAAMVRTANVQLDGRPVTAWGFKTLRGTIGPEIVAAMTAVGREVKREVALPLGVQVLAAANREALAVALACGGAFVRVEAFVFAHVADEGLLQAGAGELLRYRRAIGADHIKVYADIKKKHAAHALTADLDLVETARAAEFSLADGVIVTGVATGREAEPAEVQAVGAAVGVPTFVGSGISHLNLARYGAADGYIVGSSVKRDGVWSGALDSARVQALSRAFGTLEKRA
jgi:membrane complex biogenesis BtpA family protein